MTLLVMFPSFRQGPLREILSFDNDTFLTAIRIRDHQVFFIQKATF